MTYLLTAAQLTAAQSLEARIDDLRIAAGTMDETGSPLEETGRPASISDEQADNVLVAMAMAHHNGQSTEWWLITAGNAHLTQPNDTPTWITQRRWMEAMAALVTTGDVEGR